MNEQRTYLRGGSRIGGPRARASGGILRWISSFLMTAVPRLAPCTAGLISFVTFFGPASLCSAAESGNTAAKAASQATSPAGNSQAAPTSGGIRDPHAYMQELAAKLDRQPVAGQPLPANVLS